MPSALYEGPRLFVCQSCGAEKYGWLNRCDVCGAWNSYEEQGQAAQRAKVSAAGVVSLASVSSSESTRLRTGIDELDRVLGGGFVRGSAVLIGGEPGIGKSTLLLQACVRLAAVVPVLYVCAEETVEQVKLRADRIGGVPENLHVTGDANIVSLRAAVEAAPPGLLVVDSIQTVYTPDANSSPGSITQVRECGGQLIALAKSSGVPTIIVGHVTQDGTIAGPRVLEHLVDAVLFFEGDQHHSFRILRAIKNRFGSSAELGIFEMASDGLRPVANPSKALLAERRPNAPGSVVSAIIEGSRAFLVEIQALVIPTLADTAPKRHFEGVDSGRCEMLLAVLERLEGVKVSEHDIYVSAAGGFKAIEPSVDLAVCLAVASAISKRPFGNSAVAVGEVGLLGEVRSVPMLQTRLAEAEQLSFETAMVPKTQSVNLGVGVSVAGVGTLGDALASVSVASEAK